MISVFGTILLFEKSLNIVLDSTAKNYLFSYNGFDNGQNAFFEKHITLKVLSRFGHNDLSLVSIRKKVRLEFEFSLLGIDIFLIR